jgi:RNA polymerase sigma-70 factor, ECF subfamily
MNNKLYLDFECEAIPHLEALYNFAIGISGHNKNAKKLLLETYSKAYFFFDKIERGNDTKTWLFRIILNACNYFDKKKIQTQEDIYLNEVKVQRHDEQFSAENISSEELKKAISSLPIDLRILIILHDVEDFSYEQMAGLVDVPFNVVMLRLFKARRILYSKIQEIRAKN